MTTTDSNDRRRVQYEVASEPTPMIPEDRMTPEQKKAAAEIAAGAGTRDGYVANKEGDSMISEVRLLRTCASRPLR